MDKKRFIKNHEKTYFSLLKELNTVVVLLRNSEKEAKLCAKRFTNGNMKRKRREQERLNQLNGFCAEVQKRGDKITKILQNLKEEKVEVQNIGNEKDSSGLDKTN